MRRRVAGLCVFLALVTPSCINIRDYLGVSLESGTILLWYPVCEQGPAVTGISLSRPLGEPPWRGDDYTIVWRVETRHARRGLNQFQVGVTPPGFDEVVPLRRPLPKAGRLEVVIDSTFYRNDRFLFSLDDLREEFIYRPDPDDHVTVREFYADACD